MPCGAVPIQGFPVTIYYAFKQSERVRATAESPAPVGRRFLMRSIRAGFAITGTWPMRTEGAGRIGCKGHQRPSLQHRPRLPPPPPRRPPRHPPRVPHRPPIRTPQGPPAASGRQHRPSRPRPGCHRPRHGHIHPLRGVLHRPDLGPAIAGAAALLRQPPRERNRAPRPWLYGGSESGPDDSSGSATHRTAPVSPSASPRP